MDDGTNWTKTFTTKAHHPGFILQNHYSIPQKQINGNAQWFIQKFTRFQTWSFQKKSFNNKWTNYWILLDTWNTIGNNSVSHLFGYNVLAWTNKHFCDNTCTSNFTKSPSHPQHKSIQSSERTDGIDSKTKVSHMIWFFFIQSLSKNWSTNEFGCHFESWHLDAFWLHCLSLISPFNHYKSTCPSHPILARSLQH